MTVNILTMNHGNLTRNPKLDGRELKHMPMRDQTDRSHGCCCTTVLTSYASTKRTHFYSQDENARGYKGIVWHCDQVMVC